MQVETGFPTSVHWSVRSRINHLQRGGGEKKIFQYFIDSIGEEILYLQAFQGHSRENPVDPSLQDNVLIPNDFVKYVCHVGCHHQYALYHRFRIDEREEENAGRERQTVFFTAVDPMAMRRHEQKEFDLTKPRLAASQVNNGRHTKMQCIGSTSGSLREKGLKFFQTRSNAIIPHDILPSICVERVVSSKRHKKSCTQKIVSVATSCANGYP